MKFRGMVGLLTLVVFLALAGGGLAQEKAFLWDGSEWPQLSHDAKVGYVKGVGNLADFEVAAAKAKGFGAPIAGAFASELTTKSVDQIIDQVDGYYTEHPDKLDTSVLEVILIRCTSYCPPGVAK